MPIAQCPCCPSNRRCAKFVRSAKVGNGRLGWNHSSQESSRDRWSAQPCVSSRSLSRHCTMEICSRTSFLRSAPCSPGWKRRPWDGRIPQGPWHPPLRSLTLPLFKLNLYAACSASLCPPNAHLRSLARLWRGRRYRARSALCQPRCRINTLRTHRPLHLLLRLKLRPPCLIRLSPRKLAASSPYSTMTILLRLLQPLNGSTMLHPSLEPRQLQPRRLSRCLPVLPSHRPQLHPHLSAGTPKPQGIRTRATPLRPLRLLSHH